MLLQWLQLPCDPEDQLDQPYQHTVSKPAAFPYLTLIHLAEISTRKKPWRCDRCGFSTGHRGSLSRHRKNGRCGVSTSTPVNSSSHNDYYQSDGPIASPLPTSSTSSSYPAVIAPLAISISPYAGMAPDQYGLPSFPHQLLPPPRDGRLGVQSSHLAAFERLAAQPASLDCGRCHAGKLLRISRSISYEYPIAINRGYHVPDTHSYRLSRMIGISKFTFSV